MIFASSTSSASTTSGAPKGAGGSPSARILGIPSGGVWLRLLLGVALIGLFRSTWLPPSSAQLRVAEIALDVVLGLWVVLRPGSAGVLIVLVAAMSVRAYVGQPTLDAQLVDLLLLIPVVHQLAALAAVIPPRAVLRPAVLLPTALRLGIALLVTVVIVLLVPLG